MDVREIREMSDDEILESLEEQKRALFNLRFQTVSGQVKDTNIMGQTKRDVARLKTVLRERQLAARVAAIEGNNGE